MRWRALLLTAVVVGFAVSSLGHAVAGIRIVDSGAFFFRDTTTNSETQIVITEGDQLSVRTLDDGGHGARHTVDIPALGVSSHHLDEGEVFTTPPLSTPGTYEMHCRNHRTRGHITTLVILADSTTTTTTTAAPPSTTSTTTTQPPGPTTTTTQPPGTTTTTTTQLPGPTTTTTAPPGPTTTTTPVNPTTTQKPGPAPATPVDPTLPLNETPDLPLGNTATEPPTTRGVPELTPVDWTEGAPSPAVVAIEVDDFSRGRAWLGSIAVGLLSLIPLGGLALWLGRPRKPTL